MPVKGIYKPDHVEMGKFMISEQARKPAVEVARAIVTDLAATVTRSRSNTGTHLADDYHVNENPPPVLMGEEAPRSGAEVWSDNPAAAPEEFGGRGGAKNKPRRWLGKAGAKYHVPMGGKA